jgi:hypothetical protein
MLNSPLEVAHVGAYGVSRSDHGLIVLPKILDASVIAGVLMTVATFYPTAQCPEILYYADKRGRSRRPIPGRGLSTGHGDSFARQPQRVQRNALHVA